MFIKLLNSLKLIGSILIYEKLGVILGVTFKTLIEMKISNASKEAIVPLIIGDNNELWTAKSGKNLVSL